MIYYPFTQETCLDLPTRLVQIRKNKQSNIFFI